jgi:hypothetical protein
MQEFFIDTANPTAIKDIWYKINSEGLSDLLAGITTNPKSLAKYFQKEFTLQDLKEHLSILNNLMTDDLNAPDRIIYIQIPNDKFDPEILSKMVNFVQTLDFKVGIKIPHYLEFLLETEKYYNVSFNVTGVADFSVAAKALSWKHLDYVSVIPGRMEENGIEYTSGLNILRQNHNFFNNSIKKSRVIAGSMRTLAQLENVLKYQCVPTLGESAFSNIIPELESSNKTFLSVLLSDVEKNFVNHDEYNVSGSELSKAFFEEMNTVNLLKI